MLTLHRDWLRFGCRLLPSPSEHPSCHCWFWGGAEEKQHLWGSAQIRGAGREYSLVLLQGSRWQPQSCRWHSRGWQVPLVTRNSGACCTHLFSKRGNATFTRSAAVASTVPLLQPWPRAPRSSQQPPAQRCSTQRAEKSGMVMAEGMGAPWLGDGRGDGAAGHSISALSVSAQVKGSQDGAGPSCVSPRAPSSVAGPQNPLEMNLCWNEIKKKSHSLR